MSRWADMADSVRARMKGAFKGGEDVTEPVQEELANKIIGPWVEGALQEKVQGMLDTNAKVARALEAMPHGDLVRFFAGNRLFGHTVLSGFKRFVPGLMFPKDRKARQVMTEALDHLGSGLVDAIASSKVINDAEWRRRVAAEVGAQVSPDSTPEDERKGTKDKVLWYPGTRYFFWAVPRDGKPTKNSVNPLFADFKHQAKGADPDVIDLRAAIDRGLDAAPTEEDIVLMTEEPIKARPEWNDAVLKVLGAFRKTNVINRREAKRLGDAAGRLKATVRLDYAKEFENLDTPEQIRDLNLTAQSLIDGGHLRSDGTLDEVGMDLLVELVVQRGEGSLEWETLLKLGAHEALELIKSAKEDTSGPAHRVVHWLWDKTKIAMIVLFGAVCTFLVGLGMFGAGFFLENVSIKTSLLLLSGGAFLMFLGDLPFLFLHKLVDGISGRFEILRSLGVSWGKSIFWSVLLILAMAFPFGVAAVGLNASMFWKIFILVVILGSWGVTEFTQYKYNESLLAHQWGLSGMKKVHLVLSLMLALGIGVVVVNFLSDNGLESQTMIVQTQVQKLETVHGPVDVTVLPVVDGGFFFAEEALGELKYREVVGRDMVLDPSKGQRPINIANYRFTTETSTEHDHPVLVMERSFLPNWWPWGATEYGLSPDKSYKWRLGKDGELVQERSHVVMARFFDVYGGWLFVAAILFTLVLVIVSLFWGKLRGKGKTIAKVGAGVAVVLLILWIGGAVWMAWVNPSLDVDSPFKEKEEVVVKPAEEPSISEEKARYCASNAAADFKKAAGCPGF